MCRTAETDTNGHPGQGEGGCGLTSLHNRGAPLGAGIFMVRPEPGQALLRYWLGGWANSSNEVEAQEWGRCSEARPNAVTLAPKAHPWHFQPHHTHIGSA